MSEKLITCVCFIPLARSFWYYTIKYYNIALIITPDYFGSIFNLLDKTIQ